MILTLLHLLDDKKNRILGDERTISAAPPVLMFADDAQSGGKHGAATSAGHFKSDKVSSPQKMRVFPVVAHGLHCVINLLAA